MVTTGPIPCKLSFSDTPVFFSLKGSAMTSPMLDVLTLAHVPGGVMIAVLVVATVAGFVAGMLFERSVSQRSRDDEN